MDFVLDTNIFLRKKFLCSKDFHLLFDYLEKTGSRIVVPEIVWGQILAVCLRELHKRCAKLEAD